MLIVMGGLLVPLFLLNHDDNPMERICLGFQLHSERKLTPRDTSILQQQAHTWLSHGLWSVMGAVPLIALLPISTIILPSETWHHISFNNLWFGVFLLCSFLWTASILRGFRCFQRYRLLRKALKRGLIVEYRGTLKQLAALDWGHYKLARYGMLYDNPEQVQIIELLPQHNILFRCNEVIPTKWMRLHVAEVASQPKSTYRVPLSTVIPSAQTEAPHLERRHLQPDERQELELHIKSMLRPIGFVSLLLLLLMLALGSQVWMLLTQPKMTFLFFCFAIFFTWASFKLGKRIWLASRELRNMRHDLKEGWVICIPNEAKPKVEMGTFLQDSSSEEGLVEVLPFSTTVWSVEGERADWRLEPLG